MKYSKAERRLIAQIREVMRLEREVNDRIIRHRSRNLPSGCPELAKLELARHARIRCANLLRSHPSRQLTYNGRIYRWVRDQEFESVPIGVWYANMPA